jgi:hypothetical protein
VVASVPVVGVLTKIEVAPERSHTPPETTRASDCRRLASIFPEAVRSDTPVISVPFDSIVIWLIGPPS